MTSERTKPVFVLLHGAWHSSKCWEEVMLELESLGRGPECTTIALQLPSSGSIPPTPDWSEDVTLIRDTVETYVELGKDVVVIVHSFSGMTGGTALEGLDRASRRERGLAGGVVRLVYIAAFLVPEGFQHSASGTRENMVPEMKTDFEAGTITVSPEDAKDFFYQDMDDTTVAKWASELRPQSLAAFWSTTTYAAWRHIPTTYVLCLKDKPTTVAAARYLVDLARGSGPHKIDKLIEVDSGHSPFLSKPEWTAAMLVEEAGRVES